MLTFKSSKRLFFLIFVLLFIADFFLDVKPWMYLLVGVLFFLLISWGSYHLQTNFYLKGNHKASTNEKKVALTFDDGPTPEITREVLSILKEYRVPATFFLIGNQIAAHSSIVQQIVDEGHLIGNHSFSHDNRMGIFGKHRIQEELESTNSVIHKTTGKTVNWFRPPFGVTNPIIAKVVTEMGLEVIGWNIRTYDTVRKDPEAILKAVKNKLSPGSVILLHDRFQYTGKALQLILAFLSEEGYTVVPLDKLLKQEAYRKVDPSL